MAGKRSESVRSIGERLDVVLPFPSTSRDPDPSAIPAPARNKGGRPRKIAKMTISEAEDAITAELPKLLERLSDLALGVIVAVIEAHEEEDPETGEIRTVPMQRFYRMPPDKDALKYLTERVMGRVPQRVELSGQIEETFKVIPWMPRDDAEKKHLVGPIVKRVLTPDPTVVDGDSRVLDGAP